MLREILRDNLICYGMCYGKFAICYGICYGGFVICDGIGYLRAGYATGYATRGNIVKLSAKPNSIVTDHHCAGGVIAQNIMAPNHRSSISMPTIPFESSRNAFLMVLARRNVRSDLDLIALSSVAGVPF